MCRDVSVTDAGRLDRCAKRASALSTAATDLFETIGPFDGTFARADSAKRRARRAQTSAQRPLTGKPLRRFQFRDVEVACERFDERPVIARRCRPGAARSGRIRRPVARSTVALH